MSKVRRAYQYSSIGLMLLFAQLLFAAPAQTQTSDVLNITERGHGRVTSRGEDQEISSVRVVLRDDGKMFITVCADLQLQAEGTWSPSTSSPDEVLLKITGGVLDGDMAGSGKLLLTNERTSFKNLTLNATLRGGLNVSVTFVADDSQVYEDKASPLP